MSPPRNRGPFDVWAPVPTRVRLSIGDATVEMTKGADDWWTPSGQVPDPSVEEVDYGYLIDDADTPVPDPRSRRQPTGVHDRSRTYWPQAFDWTDCDWTGRQLAGSVIYELHVGTFTPEGTFDAALGKLDHLREIGVDFVEVLGDAVPGSAVADLVVVLAAHDQPPRRHPFGVDRYAVVAPPERGVDAVVEEAALAHLAQGRERLEVGVVALRLAGQRDVDGVVEVVAPLRVEAVAAGLPGRDQYRVVEIRLRDQGQRASLVGRQGGHFYGHLLEQVDR